MLNVPSASSHNVGSDLMLHLRMVKIRNKNFCTKKKKKKLEIIL